MGIDDQSVTSLISNYNTLVQRRNLLLQSASESSPSVTPLTSQIGELEGAIRRSLNQTRRNMNIQRNSVASQYSVYQGRVGQNPEQERMLTQIGRQQEVKSGLYLMLLQKREENSISLAATADKGKLIDQPTFMGQVSPDRNIILLVALLVALLLPALILFLIQFFHYKIEGHEDVARLTKLPILADVAVASETAKTKADIVVHENKNNMMEEIFRSLRTNLQFMLTGDQKVIMFTSTISGEGKTFITSNLSVSFALLGKKVILVGLDIRKPRLAELFEINDNSHGITNLLVRDNPDWATIQSQILPSGINNNLDLLMAGPIPPNPAELVSRKSLGEIFAELRQHYDYILVDTAPVGLVTDTIQVGNVCDLTVYTCRADYTPKESFELINNLAATKKLPKIGIVINGIDMSKKNTATTMAMDAMAVTDATGVTANTAIMAHTVVTVAMATTAKPLWRRERRLYQEITPKHMATIAVDFDGTIVEHRYPHIGEERPCHRHPAHAHQRPSPTHPLDRTRGSSVARGHRLVS